MKAALPLPGTLPVPQPVPAEPEDLVEFDPRAELLAMLWAVPTFLLLFLAFAVMMPGGPTHG